MFLLFAAGGEHLLELSHYRFVLLRGRGGTCGRNRVSARQVVVVGIVLPVLFSLHPKANFALEADFLLGRSFVELFFEVTRG